MSTFFTAEALAVRRLLVEELRYHAYLRGPRTGEHVSAVSRALADVGFERQAASPLQDDVRYHGPEGTRLKVAWSVGSSWPQMLVGGLDEAGFQQLGAFRVVRMLARVSEAAEVHLGRTFGDALWTAVTEHELDGAIDCFHWFQYFDASLASRWPDPVWASEPVFETVSHANGSRHLVMGPSPFDSLYSVKAAAAHFGMTLRSIPITHVDGTKSVFRWA